MLLGLNWEGTKQNTFTKKGLPIKIERQEYIMPLEFIDLNSLPVFPVNCDNQKVMGKEKMVHKET